MGIGNLLETEWETIAPSPNSDQQITEDGRKLPRSWQEAGALTSIPNGRHGHYGPVQAVQVPLGVTRRVGCGVVWHQILSVHPSVRVKVVPRSRIVEGARTPAHISVEIF